MFEELLETLKEGFKVLANDKEIPRLMAKYVKVLFEALKKEGFTEEQALNIVASMAGSSPISSK